MITLDKTRYSVVVLCDRCPWFAGLASSAQEGWEVASEHERRAHRDADQARRALAEVTRRRNAG